jgi:uncharacterized protein
VLAYIEEQGIRVSQLDGMSRRKVTLVESAWTTSDPGRDEVAHESCGL